MLCPYCGKEMAQGQLTSGRDNAYWRPKTSGLREWVDRHYNEQVLLTKGFLPRTEAWYCPDCRKVVIEVAEEEGYE